MGRFLQTPRLSASIDPRRGEGVRKCSASTSPFLTGSPLLICPQREMPAQESTTCRHPFPGLSGAGRLSRDPEVSSGHPLPSPQAKLGKLWLLPASLWGRRGRGVPRRVWSALGQRPMGTSHCTAGPGQRCTGWLWELSPGTMEPFKQPGLCKTMALLVSVGG